MVTRTPHSVSSTVSLLTPAWQIALLGLVMAGVSVTRDYFGNLVAALLGRIPNGQALPWPGFGRTDFIEYWSANQLMTQGNSPYDSQAMNAIQLGLGHPAPPLMMWNPPWVLTLLKPVLGFDFPSSANYWLITNIGLLIASVFILVKTTRPVSGGWSRIALIVACLLSFQPALQSLQLGQLGIFLMFWVSVVYSLMVRRCYFAAGLACTCLLVKPHLFLTLGVTILWWVVYARQPRLIFGLGTGLILLLACTQILHPGWWPAWKLSLETMSREQGATRIADWVCTTLTGTVRAYGAPIFGNYTTPLAMLIPLVSPVIWVAYLIRCRPQIEWDSWFPPLVAFSAWLSIFGWSFDFAVAFPLYFLLVMKTSSLVDRVISFGLMGWGFLALTIELRVITHFHQLFFVLPGILLAWAIHRKFSFEQSVVQ